MGYARRVRQALVLLVAGALAAAGLVSARAAADEPCDNAPLPGAPTITVLVFGDSLTASSAGDYSWRYRYWKQQRALGVNVVFVGPISGMMGTLDYPVPDNQEYADTCFNQREHWAVGGKRLEDVFEKPWWLSSDPDAPTEVEWAVRYWRPDVVVEFMGGNDLGKAPTATSDEVVALARRFVDEARKGDSAVEIGVATTTSNSHAEAELYNAKLKAQAPGWSTAVSKVGVIDVMSDWEGVSDTWDGVHGHARGEMHLAWSVGDGLAAMGFGKKPPRPIPVVPLGPRVPPTLALGGKTSSSVTLTWVGPIGADRTIIWMRDVTNGSPWVEKAAVSLQKSEAITGLAGGTYEFRVQAAKGTAVAENLYSNTVRADLAGGTGTPTPTSTPVTVGRVAAPTVLPNHHGAVVTWGSVAAATEYRLSWRPVGSTAWARKRTPGTGLSVPNLVAGLAYVFRVSAIRDGVFGQESPERIAVPKGTVNPAVAPPRLSVASGHRLRIRWEDAVDATRYQVRIRPILRNGSGVWRTLGWTGATSFTSARLVKGRVYAVRIRAWDQYVAGKTSNGSRLRMR